MFAVIPITLVSRETLLYVGFSEERATELWNRWTNWPAGSLRREIDSDPGGLYVTFEDIIMRSCDSRPDTTSDDVQEWRACLEQCGIEIGVQDKILDPRFGTLYLTESCKFWIKDTLAMRWAGLQNIQRSSRERETQLQRNAHRLKYNDGGTTS